MDVGDVSSVPVKFLYRDAVLLAVRFSVGIEWGLLRVLFAES